MVMTGGWFMIVLATFIIHFPGNGLEIPPIEKMVMTGGWLNNYGSTCPYNEFKLGDEDPFSGQLFWCERGKKQGFDHHPIINDGQTQYIMNHKNDWEW